MDRELRVIAFSAPQFQAVGVGQHALSSSDPASLFNACRCAAQRAETGVGAWSTSNWTGTRAERRTYIHLFHTLPDAMQTLEEQLKKLRPNLVLVGAMTICLRGAIECAGLVKQILGDDVCVVLGGRHANETMYRQANGTISHHRSSPLNLIASSTIPDVFDIVLSGDGEFFIADLGEMVANTVRTGEPAKNTIYALPMLAKSPGR